MFENLAYDLLIVLGMGLVSGLISRRIGVSLLVGYLLIGALIGEGGLHWVTQENRELEFLARGGALLLLFSIGLEFSLDEFVRMLRLLIVGGFTQMACVSVLVTLALLPLLDWRPAVLIALAISLSSTVLVFKALAEAGATDSGPGRQAIAILLFQDIALVPLTLLIPLLTGPGDGVQAGELARLLFNSLAFVLAIPVLRLLLLRWAFPFLATLRSRELVVLFSLSVLGCACAGAVALGLPPAIGAFGAGLLLGGHRLSTQIDALLLPFRESFAAVFFVSLGTLLQPGQFLQEPVLIAGGLLLITVVKTLGGGLAFRLTGAAWKTAFAMWLGLAQLGEFSFVLFSEARSAGLIQPADYNRLLFLAMASLLLTPQLIGVGLRQAARSSSEDSQDGSDIEAGYGGEPGQPALVIGAGPVGCAVAREFHNSGRPVTLVDLSPVNLHVFAQDGFSTTAGDATDPRLLQIAHASTAATIIVCVPRDDVAIEISRAVRSMNTAARLIVRCRFIASEPVLLNTGADVVISEESRASQAILELLRPSAQATGE